MEQSIKIMTDRIAHILHGNNPSICLFGSVVLDDFKLGWSDIDIICLTDTIIQNEQANALVNLRQTLMSEYDGNQYFRLFEGGMLTKTAFAAGNDDTVVYWGTSGQRITNKYELDPFSKMELLKYGKMLLGEDIGYLIPFPTRVEIVSAIQRNYETIRKFGDSHVEWLLDIARGLYTLRTNEVSAKTKAGEWSLEEGLCPDVEIMERGLEIRNDPLKYLHTNETKLWSQGLKPYIQRFADILEVELKK
jgi:hypothetical protein